MSGALEFTILGCGSSGGVPRADGDWGACDPLDSRNRRSRCSLLVRRKAQDGSDNETTVIVDTSPDLRQQTAAAKVRRIDAALFTHDHADQTHGIDDLRAFAIRNRRRTPCFMDEATERTLLQRFRYIFESLSSYPAICEAKRLPDHGAPWSVVGPSGPIPVLTFDQDHAEVRSVGYRFGDVAYSSDVVDLDPNVLDSLAGLNYWIIDCLRYHPHPSHAHLEKTLAWIEAVKPRQAILTNMHIDLDYATLAAKLPAGVVPAYDGMRFEVAI